MIAQRGEDVPQPVRLLERLEQLGVAEDTLLVITSDHGMPLPFVKGQIKEDGFRLPFVARWGKAIQPGRVVRDFVNVRDIAPTFLELAGVADARAVATQWLERVGLGSRLRQYPKHLSGGEQQRVALARAFAPNPRVLLADEPTGNLDPETSIGIMQLIYRINKTGTTVVVATHDKEMVDKMRRRVVELRDGRIVRDEQSGLYRPDESTTEFAIRLRGELGVGSLDGWYGVKIALEMKRRSTAVTGAYRPGGPESGSRANHTTRRARPPLTVVAISADHRSDLRRMCSAAASNMPSVMPISTSTRSTVPPGRTTSTNGCPPITRMAWFGTTSTSTRERPPMPTSAPIWIVAGTSCPVSNAMVTSYAF